MFTQWLAEWLAAIGKAAASEPVGSVALLRVGRLAEHQPSYAMLPPRRANDHRRRRAMAIAVLSLAGCGGTKPASASGGYVPLYPLCNVDGLELGSGHFEIRA